MEDDDKLPKSNSKVTTNRTKQRRTGIADTGESESSCEENDEEPKQDEIVDDKSMQSFESASVATTLSSGIGDAGFLYRRLKVLR